jgi:hypothetical protein
MLSPRQYIDRLLSFPEIQVLLRCAERCRLRFGLRGGILRNTLLGEGTLDNAGQSLYDLVDPFSDIDSRKTSAPHTFIARCRLCECEGTYAITDIQKFDGEPQGARFQVAVRRRLRTVTGGCE